LPNGATAPRHRPSQAGAKAADALIAARENAASEAEPAEQAVEAEPAEAVPAPAQPAPDEAGSALADETGTEETTAYEPLSDRGAPSEAGAGTDH
jgi:hypothetical protein